MANSSHAHLRDCKNCIEGLSIKKDSDSVAYILSDAELAHFVYVKNSGRVPVYIYKDYLPVLASIGSPMVARIVEELGYSKIVNFIAFGSAGCIDNNLDVETMIVVERAIRDEGTSYHYRPPRLCVETDEGITKAIERVFIRHGVKY